MEKSRCFADQSLLTQKRDLVLQGLLCILCVVVGILYPTLLDWSKSTTEVESIWASEQFVQRERSVYPFCPISVGVFNTALQLSIALAFVKSRGRMSELFADPNMVWKMAPIGVVTAIGELLTLRSVQKASGPVYVTISNAKLVMVAVMSRVLFGKSYAMPLLHWFELIFISLLATAYTLSEADALGSAWDWDGAWSALAKSCMNSFIAVFCEHMYKNRKLHIVLTLQAMWSFITIVSMIGLALTGIAMHGVLAELKDDNGALSLFRGGPDYPLCDSYLHEACVTNLPQAVALASSSMCKCVRARGWDFFTLRVVVADLANSVTSVLVFKRLTAVAKYMCRAMSALPMYIFYCLTGRSAWNLQSLVIIGVLCLQVSVYTLQRQKAEHLDATVQQQGDLSWTKHYQKNGDVAGNEECLRQRAAIARV